jgi:tRNA G18 (ribose-2'-O)-methylase SpoU
MASPINVSDCTKEEIKAALNEVRHPVEIAVFDSSNYFNLGAIIRLAHNFLVKKIYAVNLNDFYPKAAMNARHWEEIVKIDSEEFFKTVSGRSIVAFERRPNLTSQDLYTFSWPDNPILIFGGEKVGFSDEVLSKCHSVVSIPVYGIQNDHNVAVAAGIALYDWASKFYTKSTR